MTSNAPPEQKIARRRRWLWLLPAIASGFLVIGGLWILFQATIAPIIEDTIRDYAGRYGIENIRLDVRQVTPWHADIHALQIGGPTTGDQLRFDSLVLDYSPASLNAHVIDGVQLSGLDLRLEKSAKGWILAGLPSRLSATPETLHSKTPQPPHQDWRINRLEIRNSRLEIRQGHRQITIPFAFQAQTTGEAADRYRGQLRCQPWGQPITTTFDLDLTPPLLIIEGAAASLDLQSLSQALAPQTNLALKGRLAAVGQARLALSPLSLDAAELQIRLPGAITVADTLTLRALAPEQPLATVKLATDRTWMLHVPGFACETRDRLQIRDWSGRLVPAETGWHWDGAFDLDFHPHATDPPAGAPPLGGNTMPVTYKGQWRGDDRWSLSLAGQGERWKVGGRWDQKPDADAGPFLFAPRLNINANGRRDHVQIEGSAQLRDFRGSLQGMAVRVPMVSLQAAGEGPWHQFSGRYNVKADNFRVQMKSLDGHLQRLSVEGALATANGGLQIAGQTRISRGVVRLPDQQMRLDGLRLEIPFTWPHDPSTVGGSFHLAAATWNDLALGAVRGRIRQQADGADFRLTHQSQVLPGGKLQIDGRLTLGAESTRPRVDIDYRFERASGPDDIDLGALMTNLAGIHFNGHIDAQGRGTYQAGQMHAGLEMKLTGGRLVLPEQKSGLVGLRGSVVFPNLLAMRSAPRQQVFFERAYVGDIAATGGQLDFQIEPGGVFFLEQGRFQWCRGTVYLPATRVIPEKNDYDLTLWCDRLKLAPLLEQLGAAQAEGGGTVSGRIPVRIRQGQFRVDNGFLYSSPGEGGTIRLHGTDMLTAGIPPGTPQYNQIELARQALREYDYDWVKLSLATAPQEDLLRLKLQLNGRPANPLPFVYDTQAGGFVPAGPGSPGSRFEEIKLDVNFSLPLNRLLEYKDLLKLFS